MNFSQILLIISFIIFVCLIVWVLSKGQRIDNDIDITKNKYNWWKDKNIK